MKPLHLFLAPLLAASALLVSASPVQADVRIEGLRKHEEHLRPYLPKINKNLRDYFKAVAVDDKETALATFYPWDDVSPQRMPEAIRDALVGAALIKQQIDANQGVKRVEVLSSSGGDAKAKVVIEVEFNNGYKDISGAMTVGFEALQQGWSEDFKLKRGLPVVGMRAAMKTAEDWHRAALAGNITAMQKLTYKHPNIKDDQLAKELQGFASRIKTVALANGGIKQLEVADVLVSESKMEHYNKKSFSDTDYQRMAAIKVNYDIRYGNGKTERKQSAFALDKGQWKVWRGSIK